MIAALVVVASMFGTEAAAQDAAQYRFLAPPSVEHNWVYRVDVATGEVGLCWYDNGGTVGVTTCLPAGEGAGPQQPGHYRLLATNLTGETSVFRADDASGRLSICYSKDNLVVCTPQQ